MKIGQHTWIANFIWGIADDVLRYARGKYRDVILHMTELQPQDAAFECTRLAVFDMKASLDKVSRMGQFWGVADGLRNFMNAAPKVDLIGQRL